MFVHFAVPGMPPKETKKAPVKDESAAAPAPAAAAAEADASKENLRGGRPRGKGREHKGGRGGEQGEGERRRPKREFERRSGTGRGREVSRGGRGAFGLGNVEQDAHDAEKHPHEAKDVLEPVEPQTDGPAEESVPEPEPAVFTLDQFMQKREQARAKLHEVLGPIDHPVRKVDKVAEFGNMEPKNDTDLDAYIPGVKGKKEQGKKEQRCTGKAQVLDLGFQFKAPQPEFRPRERTERPEREQRGGRGGRGEGRRHETKKVSEAPVFNTQDFPSL